MHLRFLLLFFVCVISGTLYSKENLSKQEILRQESEEFRKLSEEIAKFYDLPSDVELFEITEKVLKSPLVKNSQKERIRSFNRRIFLFSYPSDDLKIKGLISLVPDAQNHPVLVFLRGGNRIFGILNPGMDLMNFEQYTVITTTYRGGVSDGEDEFGGRDVNDVKNLIEFIPELERRLELPFQNPRMYMLGGSRGGMQMFLALARFPDLQKRFSKVVSLSGMLDMEKCIMDRQDMEEMFTEDFGFKRGVNDVEWICLRNPLLTVDSIRSDLPILIMQGTKDIRVSLEEGYAMVNRLQNAGKQVTYLEFSDGEHCLFNVPDRIQLIINWLEN